MPVGNQPWNQVAPDVARGAYHHHFHRRRPFICRPASLRAFSQSPRHYPAHPFPAASTTPLQVLCRRALPHTVSPGSTDASETWLPTTTSAAFLDVVRTGSPRLRLHGPGDAALP